jgi:hypothetical protein
MPAFKEGLTPLQPYGKRFKTPIPVKKTHNRPTGIDPGQWRHSMKNVYEKFQQPGFCHPGVDCRAALSGLFMGHPYRTSRSKK